MPQRQWELLPHFVLRSTGFPFEWLQRLAFTNTAGCLDRLYAAEQERECARPALIAALRQDPGPATLRVRRRCCERVTQSRPIDIAELASTEPRPELTVMVQAWNACLARLAGLETEARDVFTLEVRLRRAALRDLIADPQFQEAVWLSSPHMLAHGLRPYLERWNPEDRPSHVRRVERQLVAYLQRVCAKNETTSFFGPINYGDFQPPEGARPAGPGAAHIKHREVFIAYWGVAALADAVAADPAVQPYLQPARSPLSRLDPVAGSVMVGDAVAVPLSARATDLLALLDGRTMAIDLARRLQLDVSEVVAELERLARLRVVLFELRPPVTTVRPLAWLLDWVRHLPQQCYSRASWLVVLQELETLRAQFAAADLTERNVLLEAIERLIERLTGVEPHRKGGEMYADRLLVYEECVGGVSPLPLGPLAHTTLQEQLGPALDLFAAHACARQKALRARGVALLARLAPDGAVSFLQLAAALRDADASFDLPESPWEAAVRSLIDRHPDAHVLDLELSALPPLDRSVLEAEVLVTSPDILLLARDESAIRDGNFQVVIGECHDTLMLWGWPLALHDQRVALEAQAADLLERANPTRQTLANVLASRRVKIIPFEYPGPTIEMLATSQKSCDDRIPVAEVSATVQDDRPVLCAPDRPAMRLYNGELPTVAHSLFGLPRVLPPGFGRGTHTPRLVLGKAVIQREQWRAARADLLPGRYQGTSFELIRDWYRTVRRLGLPRYVFARIAGERKPVLVDSANYFLLELLDSLAKPGSEVVLTEMLPAPDDLWLRDEQDAYCAELRLSAGYTIGA